MTDRQKQRSSRRRFLHGAGAAVALPVFAIQHFMYARFIAGLVPAWIPARLFWAYFVGAAFLAASGARLADKMTYAAAVALGTMFLIWVVI